MSPFYKPIDPVVLDKALAETSKASFSAAFRAQWTGMQRADAHGHAYSERCELCDAADVLET